MTELTEPGLPPLETRIARHLSRHLGFTHHCPVGACRRSGCCAAPASAAEPRCTEPLSEHQRDVFASLCKNAAGCAMFALQRQEPAIPPPTAGSTEVFLYETYMHVACMALTEEASLDPALRRLLRRRGQFALRRLPTETTRLFRRLFQRPLSRGNKGMDRFDASLKR